MEKKPLKSKRPQGYIKSKFRFKIFGIFLFTTTVFSIPFGILIHDAYSGYHFIPSHLYAALFFGALAYGPWLLMLFFLDNLVFDNGILVVYAFWGLKKKTICMDDIINYSVDIDGGIQTKLFLRNNKKYTISSSVYANYHELSTALTHNKTHIKPKAYNWKEFITFCGFLGVGVLLLISSIYSILNADKVQEKVDTITIHSRAQSIKELSSKSSHWIEMHLTDFPGFCFRVEDEAYDLIDGKVLDLNKSEEELCLEISNADFHHCQTDLQSGYIWKKGDSEENMTVYGVKSNSRTYLRSTDYLHEKEKSAHEIPWTGIVFGFIFFLFSFVFYPLKKPKHAPLR